MVSMISELPVELKSKIFTFMSHPCADMVGIYHTKAKACDDLECYAKRRLPHEKTLKAEVAFDGYWSFSLNLCVVCGTKMKREHKEIKVALVASSESCREREIRGWLYENYRLPESTLELFERLFEDDVETDFQDEEGEGEEEEEEEEEEEDN